MRPVDQQGPSDCLMACVASVFEVPLGSLPVIGEEHHDGSWYEVLQGAFRDHGHELLVVDNDPPLAPTGYQIGGGPSPRDCRGGHAVVCLNGAIAHDPHPSREGVPRIDRWYLAVPLAKAA